MSPHTWGCTDEVNLPYRSNERSGVAEVIRMRAWLSPEPQGALMQLDVPAALFKAFMKDPGVWAPSTFWDDTRIGVNGAFPMTTLTSRRWRRRTW